MSTGGFRRNLGTGKSLPFDYPSLRELDQERTARLKSERTAEDLRGELTAARSEARDAAVAQAEGRAKLEAQAAALAERLAATEQAQRKAAGPQSGAT